MKIVINEPFGGFHLPDAYCEVHSCSPYDYDDVKRTDAELIACVESDDYDGDLAVVEIPDEATDWDIWEYDGSETIIYVLDGKLNYAG